MRTIRAEIFRMIPGRPGPRRCTKFHFSAINRRCQRSRVSGETTGLQFQQRLASHCLRFPREQRSLSVGEPDTLSAQPIFEEPVLGLKEFDDDQLMAMNPTTRDRQQKREQRWHGTHIPSLSRREHHQGHRSQERKRKHIMSNQWRRTD